MASCSKTETSSEETPWLITLKKPKSSQALTRSCLDSGLEISITGIGENPGFGSATGLDKTAIDIYIYIFVCFRVFSSSFFEVTFDTSSYVFGGVYIANEGIKSLIIPYESNCSKLKLNQLFMPLIMYLYQ